MVTPLLVPWTYEALVHEVFGLHNGRADLCGDPWADAERAIWGGSSTQASAGGTHVLSESSDAFFRAHVDATYGDLGEAVSRAARGLREAGGASVSAAGGSAGGESCADGKSASSRDLPNAEGFGSAAPSLEGGKAHDGLDTNEDAQWAAPGKSHAVPNMAGRDATPRTATLDQTHRMLAEDLPAYRRGLAEVERHVALVTALRRRVDARGLLALSEAEQAIAAGPAAPGAGVLEAAVRAISGASLRIARVRIALLYGLRFGAGALPALYARAPSLSPGDRDFVAFALGHALPDVALAAARARLSGLPGLYAYAGRGTVRLPRARDSVYTAHVPPLLDVVDAAVRGRLPPASFPAVPSAEPIPERAQEVVVLFVNGSTHAEAAALRGYCAAHPGVSAVLLGTSVLNSSALLCELASLHRRFGAQSSG